jgi:hypothetical protein
MPGSEYRELIRDDRSLCRVYRARENVGITQGHVWCSSWGSTETYQAKLSNVDRWMQHDIVIMHPHDFDKMFKNEEPKKVIN